MIRSAPGKVRKRMGYHDIDDAEYPAKIDFKAPVYGVHHMTSADCWLVHAGNKLYRLYWHIDEETNEARLAPEHEEVEVSPGMWEILPTYDALYTGMSENRSVSFEVNNRLIIVDGTKVLISSDGENVSTIDSEAYVPTLVISQSPEGGGTEFESLNMLSPYWIEEYNVDSAHASATIFQLSFGDLDNTPVEAWVLDNEGEWQEKEEGVDFTVNRETGTVTFASPPGQTPATGFDNVRIKAARTVEGYADRINRCTVGAVFGISGQMNRLFLSGNPDKGIDENGEPYSYINYDWFSAENDPTYFADDSWNRLGSSATPIMGYTIINNYLAAHKGGGEQPQAVILREGDIIDDIPTFKIVNNLQGRGAISKYCFGYLETEPMFLTDLGAYAITAYDITGEKYSQNRSYYLDGKLTKEPHLENAFSFTHKDYYFICVNDHVYVLDGLQPLRPDNNKPYATRQYVGFYWEGVPATVMFEVEGDLFFCTNTGKMYKFYTDDKDVDSYNDDGEPIYALWETADIYERQFYKNKTYRYLALKCFPYTHSSVKIYGQRFGLWELIKGDATTLRFFRFSTIVFSKFTFSPDQTAKVSPSKIRIKKVDHTRFRFVNDELNEPFGIIDFAVEYRQGGNKKG